jgi:hypothetical protein
MSQDAQCRNCGWKTSRQKQECHCEVEYPGDCRCGWIGDGRGHCPHCGDRVLTMDWFRSMREARKLAEMELMP